VSLILFACEGGHLVLPDRGSLLLGRESGGHIIVLPPRQVWERSELTPGELGCFAFLVAAAGRAMIDTLPQLEGGCVNYFDAGNWALNDEAEPKGRKIASAHRKMHQHLLGRSPASTDPSWQWGESPRFPAFAEKDSWAAGFERLTAAECYQVVSRADALLRTKYGLLSGQIAAWSPCDVCAYPTPVVSGEAHHVCAGCRAS
jgi:diadenosine tetraphosphate (Ap4A) HIT family hydrolase